jgi:hypothetical protein
VEAKDQALPSSNSTYNNTSSSNSSLLPYLVFTKPEKLAMNLTAKILTISQGGLTTIVFSQPLKIPDSYTLLDGE